MLQTQNTNENEIENETQKFKNRRMNGGHLSQSISIFLRVWETGKWHLTKKNECETLFPKNKSENENVGFWISLPKTI